MPPFLQMHVPPTMVRGATGLHSAQVNVDSLGNNILGDAANEPSMMVDPNNPNHIAIGWRQFDNVASNFRQAGWAYSTNGGATWTFPGVLEPGVFHHTGAIIALDRQAQSGQSHSTHEGQTFFAVACWI